MANTYTNLLYHIVYSTKHREPLITPALRENLYSYIGGIIRGESGTLLQIGGMPDHLHLVTRFKSEPSVAQMVKTFKAKSSKWVNEQPNRPGRFSWQTGYGAFTVSPSQLEKVIRYVRCQEEHHRIVSFKEELVLLLDRHGIEYDEQYLWD
ncbi:MAG: IS200/IS605 family transposase [Planctomycetota bacterium]